MGVTAAGLFAYTLWRLVDGVLDLENEGDDLEGYANRAGQIMSGLTHAALGISAIIILMKGAQANGGDSSAENWSATLMQHPAGRLIVIAAGITTLSVAIYLFIKSLRPLIGKTLSARGWPRSWSPQCASASLRTASSCSSSED